MRYRRPGQALVESALVLPVFIVSVVLFMLIAMYGWNYASYSNIASEAANQGAKTVDPQRDPSIGFDYNHPADAFKRWDWASAEPWNALNTAISAANASIATTTTGMTFNAVVEGCFLDIDNNELACSRGGTIGDAPTSGAAPDRIAVTITAQANKAFGIVPLPDIKVTRSVSIQVGWSAVCTYFGQQPLNPACLGQ